MTSKSTDEFDAAVERRLHPLSWLFAIMTQARGLLLPAAALLVTARFTNVDILALPIAVVVVIQALIQQFSVRYVLGPHEMVVRRNLIVHRSERHIPYARIHNVKTSETPIHRWLGSVEVAIETAGGAEPEATLRVLSREALAELRARVAAGSVPNDAGSEATADREPLTAHGHLVLTMSSRDIVRYGLVNNRGWIIAGAIAGLAWEATASLQGGQLWDPRSWTAPWRLIRSRSDELLGLARLDSPIWFLAWLAAAFVLLKLLSIAWSLVSLHGFRVERSSAGLTVEHGLIPRTSTVIPYARIQRVAIREKPVHRLTGSVEVRLDTVGRAANDSTRSPVWLAPIAPRASLPHLLAEVGAPLELDALPWQTLHPRAAYRMRTQAVLVMSVLAAGLWPLAGIWGIAAVAAATPFALIVATQQARRYGYAVAPPYVVVRSGWLWKTIHVTWIDRVQAIAVTASPFDRRHDMASLLVDTAAGGALESKLRVPFLGAGTARALQQQLQTETATTRFHW